MTKSQLRHYEKMEADVIELNVRYKVGETVLVKKDDGDYEMDKIKYPFSIMCGGVVAWLQINGSYLAERVVKYI